MFLKPNTGHTFCFGKLRSQCALTCTNCMHNCMHTHAARPSKRIHAPNKSKKHQSQSSATLNIIIDNTCTDLVQQQYVRRVEASRREGQARLLPPRQAADGLQGRAATQAEHAQVGPHLHTQRPINQSTNQPINQPAISIHMERASKRANRQRDGMNDRPAGGMNPCPP